jgi:hypothetical protein
VRYRLGGSTAGMMAAGSTFLLLAHPAIAQAPKSSSAAKTWTQPKTPWGDPDLQGTWTSDDCIGTGYRNFEYACHEGNYAMFDSLSGARAKEKQAAAAAATKQ